MPVNIHGKEYRTVAERVDLFHQNNKDAEKSIVTEVLHNDENNVMMKTTVTVNGSTYTGHALEVYGSSMINKTSALENCETSAIGRALASAGLGGTEFASADEVTNAISQQNGASKPNGVSKQMANFDKETDWETGRENPIQFGKHKGTPWKEIPMDYLKWMAESSDNENWKLMANAEVLARITQNSSEKPKETPVDKAEEFNEAQIQEGEEILKELDNEFSDKILGDDNDLPF